ncbi:Serpin-7 [Operophtera brumata]|uniref:Serpin-7 n=1 Tax=Operophtera brumata TaxID=104452 RepID=A0A0L7LTV5_OPEBR|nr:Serpin-7 [Operophtera brumata]
MARLIIFLFLTIVASVYTQCTIDNAQRFFKRSVYDFSVILAGRLSQDTEGHFVASGLSTWSLLSTISLGATRDTLSEIAYVLRMHPNKCFSDKYNQIANKMISSSGTVLERSAAVLVDTKLDVYQDFITDVAKTRVCTVEQLSFTDALYTAAYVNDLVSKATHEAIDEIVTSTDIDGASLLIIDALYFKGAWKYQFPYSDTEISAFYNDRGEQVGDVNLMYMNGVFNVTSVKQLQARVLEMPYGEENRFSMLIILPNTDVTINNVIDNLSLISLRTIFVLFSRHEPENVAVQLPRFKISSDINNLKELLMDMNLRKMFDSSEAQFDALASDPELFVSNLIQKADIEVTEDGTVASAVSEAEFESRMLPPQFVVNKPFVFMIVDRDTEIPLFTGAYSTPTENVF